MMDNNASVYHKCCTIYDQHLVLRVPQQAECVPNVVSAHPPMWNLFVRCIRVQSPRPAQLHQLSDPTHCHTRHQDAVAMVFGKRSKSWASLSASLTARMDRIPRQRVWQLVILHVVQQVGVILECGSAVYFADLLWLLAAWF
jgi:hypothetical protein